MSKILVTGSRGFLGSHVVEEFTNNGYYYFGRNEGLRPYLDCPSSTELDVTNQNELFAYCTAMGITDIIHLAADCGGIGYNQENPGSLFYRNMMMGVNVVEVARRLEMNKVLLLGTVCMYPKHAPVPFREDEIWNGYPEETNAPYGLAKKAAMVMGQAYREQYGLDCITLIPVNMTGERDCFDEGRSHVIPALIKKFLDAKRSGDQSVQVWGTGQATREFLYAGDCARAIRLAFEDYSGPEPVNIGTGVETSIADLARLVADTVGYQGEIIWDSSKPDGQPSRCLDISRAHLEFQFMAKVNLQEMIHRTVRWYEEQLSG